MKQVLRLPAYRRLLAAYALNELAWSVGTLALSVLVYRRTGSALGSAVFFLYSRGAAGVCVAVRGLASGPARTAAACCRFCTRSRASCSRACAG